VLVEQVKVVVRMKVTKTDTALPLSSIAKNG
jgi:hypothetical protein